MLGAPPQAQAAQVVQSWEVGSPTASDVTATLYDDGSLVFSGTGDMRAYERRTPSTTAKEQLPWVGNSSVKTVCFEAGVVPSDLTWYFSDCENLVTVENIPSSVTNMYATFSGCTSLAAVPTIPSAVTNMSYTFSQCTSLVEAPAISANAPVLVETFGGCTSLEKAPAIPGGVKDLERTFSGCTSLEEAPAIPEGTTSMSQAFRGCESLEVAPAIPSTVTYMGYTFNGCTSLKEAPIIPEGVTSRYWTFRGCSSLTWLPDGFKVPKADEKWTEESTFYVHRAEGEQPLKTYVNAPVDESVLYYDWASDNRELVVVGGSASSWKRLAGGTAMGTMKAIVNEGWASSLYAVVATSKGYQDALSATALAGLLKCPVMMTAPGDLSKQTKSLLVSKKVSHVLIVGGTSAVSANVEKQIKALSGVRYVDRLAGGTAIGTANKVYEYGKTAMGGWGSDAIVATAGSYQDALSIAPYAYAKKAPIFLAQAKDGTLTSKTVKMLKAGGFTRTIVVGGTSAVKSSVDKQVPNAKRLAGATAYGTCRKAAEFCLANGLTANHVGVATGQSYQDALCGAALCGEKSSILVLADDKNSNNIDNVVKKNKSALRGCYIFGGTQAVSAKVEKAVKAASK